MSDAESHLRQKRVTFIVLGVDHQSSEAVQEDHDKVTHGEYGEGPERRYQSVKDS